MVRPQYSSTLGVSNPQIFKNRLEGEDATPPRLRITQSTGAIRQTEDSGILMSGR